MTQDAIKLIMHIMATEKNNIPYRPELAAHLRSITAAILLQQVQYWWTVSHFQPFYKFIAPCRHPLYRPGDSWTEELGFTRGGFTTARNRIALKKPGQVKLQEAIYLTTHATDKRIRPVIYWTNAGRVSYYTVHAPAYLQLLQTVYLDPETERTKIRKTLIGKAGNQVYLNPETGFTVKPETDDRITEITRDHQIPHRQQQQNTKNVVGGDGWNLSLSFNNEQLKAFHELIDWQVTPNVAAHLIQEHKDGLGRVQAWIDFTEQQLGQGQDILNPAGFIIAGLRSQQALPPIKPYRYSPDTNFIERPKR